MDASISYRLVHHIASRRDETSASTVHGSSCKSDQKYETPQPPTRPTEHRTTIFNYGDHHSITPGHPKEGHPFIRGTPLELLVYKHIIRFGYKKTRTGVTQSLYPLPIISPRVPSSQPIDGHGHYQPDSPSPHMPHPKQREVKTPKLVDDS